VVEAVLGRECLGYPQTTPPAIASRAPGAQVVAAHLFCRDHQERAGDHQQSGDEDAGPGGLAQQQHSHQDGPEGAVLVSDVATWVSVLFKAVM